MVKLPLSKHTSVLLDICHHHIDSRLFSLAFSKLSWNLTMEPFKWSIILQIQLIHWRLPSRTYIKKNNYHMQLFICFICLFFHFDFKDVIKYTATLSKFLHFLWKLFFPGQTPVPSRSGTWILDLSHDLIWAIWLAEVWKFHQHHDRIVTTSRFVFLFTHPSPNFNSSLVKPPLKLGHVWVIPLFMWM